ncbi:hypothetical protein AB0M95_24700 [Sphaerisporangium sp. NPDC051017]|uniref:hypothetical protein n=1 Tax=Sphaerisporangium sp. NPDC051017 TaxID=3154636 RepID=UPI00341396F6
MSDQIPDRLPEGGTATVPDEPTAEAGPPVVGGRPAAEGKVAVAGALIPQVLSRHPDWDQWEEPWRIATGVKTLLAAR